jgi:hypothetical protein
LKKYNTFADALLIVHFSVLLRTRLCGTFIMGKFTCGASLLSWLR